MTKPPDGRMFGIKLIEAGHLNFDEFTCGFDGSDGRKTLMNFSIDRKRQADGIPVGHQCLVYVTKPPQWGRFIWAIEVTGTLKDGDDALEAFGYQRGVALPGIDLKWSLHRPIRFLARVAPPREGPTRHEIARRSGYLFRPYGGGHKYLSSGEYHRAFNAIAWTWRVPYVDVVSRGL